MATDTTDPDRFDEVDWDALQESRPYASPRTVAFLVLFVALVAFYCYDVYLVDPGDPTILIPADNWQNDTVWDVSRVDWLSLLLGVVVVSYAVVPAVLDPSRVRDAWRAYPGDALSLAALVYVAGFVLVGLLGPAILDLPTIQFDRATQPPAFTSVASELVNSCLGPVEGGHCHGTLATPLGTTSAGESILVWVVYGSRTALQFALIAAVLMVPLATAVGTTAAYLGGRYDAALMRYVETQEAIPTVVVYVVLVVFAGPTLFMLIVAYGLFNWSDLARRVRAETLSMKEEGFVTAARSAGASPVAVVRHHVVPNLSGAIVAHLGMVVPKLILIEALFSFLKLSGDKSFSWGQLIQRGIFAGSLDGGTTLTLRGIFEGVWWIAGVPTVAVWLTVLAFFVFGDAVQTAVDPRSE